MISHQKKACGFILPFLLLMQPYAGQAQTPIPVPSDPRAGYRLMGVTSGPYSHLIAVTRREGPSGVSFARREINCQNRQFRYLGEGATQADAMRDSPNIGAMSALTSGSISTEVSAFVCSARR